MFVLELAEFFLVTFILLFDAKKVSILLISGIGIINIENVSQFFANFFTSDTCCEFFIRQFVPEKPLACGYRSPLSAGEFRMNYV